MKKSNLTITIITVMVCLLPMIAGIILYDRLPDMMVIQVNANNESNRFVSKNFALFGTAGLMAMVQLITSISLGRKRKGSTMVTKFEKVAQWIIPVVSILVYYVMIMYNLYETIHVGRTVLLVLGVLFCIIGNYLPKMSYEYNGNLNLPTAKDEKSFRKMVKRIGYFLIGVGISFFVIMFFI